MQARSLWVLIIAASLCLPACSGPYSDEIAHEEAANVSVVDLSVAELAALRTDGNIRLIDVRSDSEVAQGIIPGAEHIPMSEFDPAKLDLSDGRKVVLYCAVGGRSHAAASKLSAHTGQPAEHLGGGISAWQDAGQPLAKNAAR